MGGEQKEAVGDLPFFFFEEFYDVFAVNIKESRVVAIGGCPAHLFCDFIGKSLFEPTHAAAGSGMAILRKKREDGNFVISHLQNFRNKRFVGGGEVAVEGDRGDTCYLFYFLCQLFRFFVDR